MHEVGRSVPDGPAPGQSKWAFFPAASSVLLHSCNRGRTTAAEAYHLILTHIINEMTGTTRAQVSEPRETREATRLRCAPRFRGCVKPYVQLTNPYEFPPIAMAKIDPRTGTEREPDSRACAASESNRNCYRETPWHEVLPHANVSRALPAATAGSRSRSKALRFIRGVPALTAPVPGATTTGTGRSIPACISSAAGAWTGARCRSG